MGETFADQAFPVPAHPTGMLGTAWGVSPGALLVPGVDAGGMDLAGLLLQGAVWSAVFKVFCERWGLDLV